MDAALDGVELREFLNLRWLALDDVDVCELHGAIKIERFALKVVCDLNADEVLIVVPGDHGHLLAEELLRDGVFELIIHQRSALEALIRLLRRGRAVRGQRGGHVCACRWGFAGE
eukprot:Mycagemm_TRINITY_DN10576_c0_g1::TRINITY_DN10576_c0_g1_i1::g.2973::m.2973 type:complete len:115 gc:universal TRINITY_DN10576_c0_g1_i1:3-347(+)